MHILAFLGTKHKTEIPGKGSDLFKSAKTRKKRLSFSTVPLAQKTRGNTATLGLD